MEPIEKAKELIGYYKGNKEGVMNDINEKANKKKYEFDEDDYVIIKMRKAPPIPSASEVLPVSVPVPKTFENNENINNSNGIVDEIVNDIINNAVDLYFTKEGV